MKRLLIWNSIVFAALGLTLLSARVVGSLNAQPSADKLFENEQCSPRPCWRGFRPGVTTFRQVESSLNLKLSRTANAPNYQLCWLGASTPCWGVNIRSWSNDPNDPIGMIVFEPPRGSFRLGDAVRIFGNPLTSNLCHIAAPNSGDVPLDVPRPLLVAYITLRGSIKIVAYHSEKPLLQRLDPEMTVYRIYFQDGYDIYAPRWHGFARQRLGCSR
jgi:hypothetical protein